MFRLVRLLATVLCTLCLMICARAELPAGLTYDDGFTWLECHNFERTEDNKSIGEWVLEGSFRVWGKVPANSGWRIVLRKGDRVLSDNTVDGYPFDLGGDQGKGMVIVGLWKDKSRTQETGDLLVEVYYIDGNTNAEHLAKTLKVDVRKVARHRGGVKSREQYAPSYYVNRHSEALSNILYFRDQKWPSYSMVNGISSYNERRVELILNYCENENFSSPNLGRIVCEVNGQVIEMMVPNNRMAQDKMGSGEQIGKYNVEHSDRDAAKYFEGGTPYKERIGFSRRSISLPLQWGPPLPYVQKSNVFTNDNVGEWKITWLIERSQFASSGSKLVKMACHCPTPSKSQA